MIPLENLKMIGPTICFLDHALGRPTSKANNISVHLDPSTIIMPDLPMEW